MPRKARQDTGIRIQGTASNQRMTYIPCRKRTFKLQLAHSFVRNYEQYVHFLKFLVQRIGRDATTTLWQNALLDYDDRFLRHVLSTGWTQNAGNKIENVVNELASVLAEHFAAPVDGMSAEQAKQIVEKTPPISHISRNFPTPNVVRATTAYEALHIGFDVLAILVESLLDAYGKEGELIAYDFLSESRASRAKAKPVTFSEFIAEAQSFLRPREPTIFTAGQDAEIVKVSDTEFVMHIRQCEWARYFQERHPRVGYLIACSTDEVFARTCNDKIRMQRTSTLMEGGKLCNFRYYLVE